MFIVRTITETDGRLAIHAWPTTYFAFSDIIAAYDPFNAGMDNNNDYWYADDRREVVSNEIWLHTARV